MIIYYGAVIKLSKNFSNISLHSKDIIIAGSGVSDKKLSVENIAFLFTKMFPKAKVYRILRMYYWMQKKIRNRL